MSEHLLRVYVVETDPWTFVPSEDGAGDVDLDYSLPGFVRAMVEKAEPSSLACRVCQAKIGHVEITDEGPHGEEIERVVWRWLTVVADEAEPRFDRAWALCEDCSAGLLS